MDQEWMFSLLRRNVWNNSSLVPVLKSKTQKGTKMQLQPWKGKKLQQYYLILKSKNQQTKLNQTKPKTNKQTDSQVVER